MSSLLFRTRKGWPLLFSRLKIGPKLVIGFGLLLFLFCLTGIFAWRNLGVVKAGSDDLALARIPQVDSATGVERNAFMMMYAVRGYALSEAEAFRRQGEESLEWTRAALSQLNVLTERFPQLAESREAIVEAQKQLARYQSEFENTTRAVTEMETAREAIVEAGTRFESECEALLQNQRDILNEGFTTGASPFFQELSAGRVFAAQAAFSAGAKLRLKALQALAENQPSLIEGIEGDFEALRTQLHDLERKITHGESLVQLRALNEALETFETNLIQLRSTWQSLEVADQERESAAEALLAASRNVSQSGMKSTQKIAAEAQSRAVATERALVWTLGLALLVGVLVAFLMTRSLTKPLKKALVLAERIQEGDLTVTRDDFCTENCDEIGLLADALARMVASQRNVIEAVIGEAQAVADKASSLAAYSEETNASMEEVKTSVDQTAQLSEANSAALEEANAGVEEVASSAQSSAETASAGAEAAERTRHQAETTTEEIGEVIDALATVSDKSRETLDGARKLQQSVGEIGNFVTTIVGIADQTNLLALNAAIEAARAGDAGRGFAVVAEEVRKLAEDSARAAQEVNALTGRLQKEARHAQELSDESATITASTAERASKAQKQIRSLLKDIITVSDAMTHIASAAQEQSASSQEMAAAIDQATKATLEVVRMVEAIKGASEETTKTSESVAAEAQSMAETASRLQELVERFTVTQKDLLGLGQGPAPVRALPEKS